ncbi:MAG TPA: ABC transporter ATP-binding protein [Chitinophagales bacterium]|nr:ABC transporter ATP-binding protein [Chitinophagales bacterium]
MNETVLEVKNISKSFRINESRKDSLKETIAGLFSSATAATTQFYALKNISFELKQGEVLGIIGKNGAGKSTLLKILSGIITPDEGEINFYCRSASVLEIGAGFHPELSGRENIYLAAQLYGLSKAETTKKYQSIVDFSGIEKFINEPVKNYSAGMYLRLAFAVVSHIDADILIFDEVLSVGDNEFQLQCQQHIQSLTQSGKAIIIVTHNMRDALQYCSRIMKLDSGNTEDLGEPQEVINKYIKHSVDLSARKTNAVYNFVQWGDKGAQKNFRVVSSRITKAEGAGGINLNEAFNIVTEVEMLTPDDIGCVYHVLDSTGSPVFTSFSQEDRANRTLRSGTLEFTCHFPANLFNQGLFKLSLFITDRENEIYHLGEAFYFEISLPEENTDDNFFYKKYPGPLRPKLNWKIEAL